MTESSFLRRFRPVNACLAMFALVGCIEIGGGGGSSGGDDECNDNSECKPGWVCDSGQCVSGSAGAGGSIKPRGGAGGTSAGTGTTGGNTTGGVAGTSAGGTRTGGAGGTSAGGTSAGGTSAGGTTYGGTSAGGSGTMGGTGPAGTGGAAGVGGGCSGLCEWSVRCGHSASSSECLTACDDVWATGGACQSALNTYINCVRTNSTDCAAGTGVCSSYADAFVTACSDGTCPWTNDGECDEPEGTNLCAEGTDVNDCAGGGTCVEGSAGNTCVWACDQECDEPDLCTTGTDSWDCGVR